MGSKWTDKVVRVKRAERVRREGQGRMNDLRWKINEVVIEFKKTDTFWRREAREGRLNSDKIIGMREERNLEAIFSAKS